MVNFKSKWLGHIKEIGSVSFDIFEQLLTEYVKEHIKQVSQDEIDISLIRWLCNVVENSIEKKNVVDEKVNKKEIVLKQYFNLKPNAKQYEKTLDKIIEDLHNTDQIKRVKQRTKLYHKLKSVVFTSK